MAVRKRIEIQGVVQGVGFRPFVYRIARRFNIHGRVLNSSAGVIIEAEAAAAELDRFLQALRSELPPLARIERLTLTTETAQGDDGFFIEGSLAQPGRFAFVPPDVATCDDCTADFTASSNRRFGYPFTNCTNCGPRYSIIRDIPYDRQLTTMSAFRMCARCEAEYKDPLDRRFHAEPNACADCGPSLAICSAEELSRRLPAFDSPRDSAAIVARAREMLRSGEILAIKGLGGFHLACDATNESAVAMLRERKRRSGKPFALMVASLAVAGRLCAIDEARRALLTSYARPIVLMPRHPHSPVAPSVAPGETRLGLMLPYTPLHHLLFDGSLDALVMTSGNMSEEPIVSRNDEAWPRLHALAGAFLLHNRPIRARVDDSVFQIVDGRPYPVRRSRGYAPEPISLVAPLPELLACGGELKNTFCLTKDKYAILSQHIGDLENVETMDFFEETLDHLRRFFRVEPTAVAHDLHPGYLSTRYALERSGLPPIAVQHHHAHIASCMADNAIDGTVIGVALDGAGYGEDGKIWGGEFLVCDFAAFERRGHLRYIPLAGGDRAIRQPWRSALAYLRDIFGDAALSLPLPLFRDIDPKQLRAVNSMIAKRVQTIDTSSCGRLFDAVASVLGIRHETTYEGQAAIELEMSATETHGVYPFEIGGEPFQIDFRPSIEALVNDAVCGTSRGEISARFHATVASVIVTACERLRSSDRLNRVCLSGGTFQNLRLLGLTTAALRGTGFEVFVHRRVPTNDGGLALGQALIAAKRLSCL